MTTMTLSAFFSVVLVVLVSISSVPSSSYLAGAEEVVGVNYGMVGDDLPTPHDVVSAMVAKKVTRVRLFDPNPDALTALQGSGMEVVLGTLNDDITPLATDPNFATQWVQSHVAPHVGKLTFRYISVGNEVIPGDKANDVLPAMKNLQAALRAAGVKTPVSTVVSMAAIGSSYPPSSGAFSAEALPIMAPIATFLAANNAPYLLNAYPYFPYIGDPKNVKLDYALGTSTVASVHDGPLDYFNLFDAMVDAVYWALEKVSAPGVEIVVTETGWPSGGGGEAESIANAQAYNNFVAGKVHAGKGTPKRPNKGIETYIFAMFNEDKKAPGTEQHFGLFYPNLTQVYPFTF